MKVPIDSLNNELTLKFRTDKSFNLKSLSTSEEVNGTWVYERNKKQITLKDNNGDINAIVTKLDKRILILQLISNSKPTIELFKDLKLCYTPCE
ncbi:copper resistance protein NlpE [Aquimarina aquimarini]|uniref:copper resistance protein NlpE n=2 Tax=Aquimarina aquimarini TaxID=1191734 RepID=UPI001F2DA2B3|nr:copper resistance protein NlpE [Aquimarina aquimarini]